MLAPEVAAATPGFSATFLYEGAPANLAENAAKIKNGTMKPFASKEAEDEHY